jgi:alanyl-tRNA synthetase
MKYMKSEELREGFLEFFQKRGHVIEKPDTLVPADDPTLLFTSAGMVQFKPYYTGLVPVPYRRAVTCQPCLRAGGKHNDLEEVGKTKRHTTFFEMLGNFSFGDYFKQDAIKWAWEYVVDVLDVPEETLWVTVYKEDDEAHEIWRKKVGVPDGKIVRLGEKDNFWGPVGDSGACGPCSEIHFDMGPGEGCGKAGCLPGCECDRFVEVWNLVFPQYDQDKDGTRSPLENRGIDTGMGLERLAAVIQGKSSIFESDLLMPIMEAVRETAGVPFDERPMAYRVVSDHARALAFLITEGVLPSNEGRGYVARRILRRAARYGLELGIEEPFFFKAAEAVVENMKGAYPQLEQARARISKVIHNEEERFHDTLLQGMTLLDEIFGEMEKSGTKQLPGTELFRLYDTFGFPVELAGDIASDRGYTLDLPGFEAQMEKQRERARSHWTVASDDSLAPVYLQLKDKLGATAFVGYDETKVKATVQAIVGDQDTVAENQEADVVLDATPFYAESGGQVADRGTLTAKGFLAEVLDIQTPVEGLFVLRVKVKKGELTEGLSVTACVDEQRRRETACHHTATHILQGVLRQKLGDHVHQSGSLVAPDRLRFDFTHFEAIEPETLREIEFEVNTTIRLNVPVTSKIVPMKEAQESGAIALFGEKYGDTVRAVSVGPHILELCGGTHVKRSGDIGCFKIVSEGSVAAGVRRIEAVCGLAALDRLAAEERELARISELVAAPSLESAARVEAILEENKRLAKEIERLKEKLATGQAVDVMSQIKQVAGANLLAARFDGTDQKQLRTMADSFRARMGSGIIVLGSAVEGKVALVAAVTKDLVEKIRADALLREVAKLVDGGGGGRSDMAQAGGKNVGQLSQALDQVEKIAERMIAADD